MSNNDEDDYKKQLADKTADSHQNLVKTAVTGTLLYVVLTPLGFILGGIGAYAGAAWFDITGFFYTGGLVLLGVVLGSIIGFFSAQLILAEMLGEIVWDTGWSFTKIGYKAARNKLRGKPDSKV